MPPPVLDHDALDEKANRVFAGKVVRKDLVRKVKVGANVPVFVLEYLLGKYCASSDEIYDSGAMPADVGADRPAHILGSITELRDRQVFNEHIFENPVQKAEKQAEIVVPASIDVADMSWKCGRCEFENQPVKKDSGHLVMGSIQGVYQNHQCGRCRNWLIGRNEIEREVRHEAQVERDREAVVAEHPRAIPIPGTEAERTNMTDVLAGKRVINPGQE